MGRDGRMRGDGKGWRRDGRMRGDGKGKEG